MLSDPWFTLRLSGALVAVAVAMSSAEVFASRRDYAADGVFAPRVPAGSRGTPRYRRGVVWPSTTSVAVVASFRLIVIAPLLWPSTPAWILGGCALIALLLGLCIQRVSQSGGDGAEGIATVVLGGVSVGFLSSSPVVASSAVLFVAAQATLAYTAAGLYKAWSPPWRSGEALVRILGVQTFGNARLQVLLLRKPTLSRYLAWGTVVWECTFPIVFVAPMWVALAWLLVGLLFHLGCAIVMGLNTFVWSFASTYPPLLYAHHQFRSWGS